MSLFGPKVIIRDGAPATLVDSFQRASRIAFWIYALALFVGTHWPNLQLDVPGIDRPDLIVHMTIFGTWTALFIATGYAWRREPTGVTGPVVMTVGGVALSGLVALAYAAFDEGSQAIPFVHRTCAWDDYEANATGITLVTVVGCVLAWRWRRR